MNQILRYEIFFLKVELALNTVKRNIFAVCIFRYFGFFFPHEDFIIYMIHQTVVPRGFST